MIDVDVIQAYIREANPIPHVDDVDPDELGIFVAAAHARRTAGMQAPTQHPTVSPPLQPRRKARAFAAALILVVAIIGIVALVPRDGVAPVANEQVPIAPAIESLQWSYVGLESVLNAAQTVEDVIFGGPGLVAVGREWDHAAVWTSPDGLTWSQVPYQESLAEGRMTAVTLGGPGLIAVGFLTDNAYSVMVWTSPDGITWTRVPSTPALTDGLGEKTMNDVVAGGPGFVAVGHVDYGEGVFVPSAAVWTSPDGISWTRVPHEDSVFFGGVPGADMVSVTTGGPGLVAVGNIGGLSYWRAAIGEGEPDDQTYGWRAAVWTSPDGLTWTFVPDVDSVFSAFADGPPGAGIASVTADGPGLVAVGSAGSRPAVWTSADGVDWTRIPDAAITGTGYEMTHVTTVGSGLFAVGTADYGDGEAPFATGLGYSLSRAIWTSADGLTWTRAPYDYPEAGIDMDGPPSTSPTTKGPAIVPIGDTVWIATPQD